MFPQTAGPQTGSGFTTSSMLQQNNSLLGNPQIQSTGAPIMNPPAMNTTAPGSAGVASMIKALKGA